MKTYELIAKQQLEIEELKEINGQYQEREEQVYSIIFSIGGPLNDNKLRYSQKQLITFIQIAQALDF